MSARVLTSAMSAPVSEQPTEGHRVQPSRVAVLPVCLQDAGPRLHRHRHPGDDWRDAGVCARAGRLRQGRGQGQCAFVVQRH